MFPSFPRYKEGTGGRGQIEPGPLVAKPLKYCISKCKLLYKVTPLLFLPHHLKAPHLWNNGPEENNNFNIH
jgi:hypothetical protein